MAPPNLQSDKGSESKNVIPEAKDNAFEDDNISKVIPKPKSKARKFQDWTEARAEAVWENLHTNNLWQRMLKVTLATTITIILAIIPTVIRVYGRAVYLAPITTVFGHPGRRFGQMAEALILAITGTSLGMAWSTLGVYLSSLLYSTNRPAAYTIKGLFLVVALLFHGMLRSHTPRLFTMVLLLIIVSVVSLTGTSTHVTSTTITTILYPILTATGILLLVNICVFPEFSSSFLGATTIETLGETVGALRDAGTYFIRTCRYVPQESENSQEDPIQGKPLTAAESRSKAPKAPRPGDSPSLFVKLWLKMRNAASSRLLKSLAGVQSSNESEGGELPRSANVPEEADSPKARQRVVKLKSLTDQKVKLRAKLSGCQTAQDECNFELAFAVLPSRELKPISNTNMTKLVANTLALIGACESMYALMGDDQDNNDQSRQPEGEDNLAGSGLSTPHESPEDESSAGEKEKGEDEKDEREEKERKKNRKKKLKSKLEKEIADLELIKPRKEIAFGDVELLKRLVNRIEQPLIDLQSNIDKSVDVVTSCLAYCYDVPKLPNGSKPPKGIDLKEIDIWVDVLSDSITDFDLNSAAALEGATSVNDLDGPQIDVMPRMETFLISSFLLNLRQAAINTKDMLDHSRKLVEKRQKRFGRRRLYWPVIDWKKWLTSGGEQDALALPTNARKDARTGTKSTTTGDDNSVNSKQGLINSKKRDEEIAAEDPRPTVPVSAKVTSEATKTVKIPKSRTHLFRNVLADIIEYLSGSDDVLYAIKLTVATLLVTWPAFLGRWNTWYSLNRGLWAALQLILITEVSLGTSIFTFLLRAVGTTLGCIWGYIAFQARDGNRVVTVVILVIGIIPSTYVQLGSKYIKAGMVSIISMCVVALATVDHTVPGTATENFLKRFIAFLIGGIVALIVEVILFPVRARDRLVESLATAIRQISEMEACLAYGIETEVNVDVSSKRVAERFDTAKSKASDALEAAETILPFCAQEPRLKGSFAGLALVYAEILYVLHQIVDKMDNMLQLRTEYGSGVLEELNPQVYQYRRNVASSITIILFAVHEALTTKLPLPQFLPSARLAHLRMVNRVREVVLVKVHEREAKPESMRSQIELSLVKRVVRQKFLSWNAASAGQTEVIEYLEELIDLTKLLVGANEFRSGMLTRPTYHEYVDRITLDEEPDLAQPTKSKSKVQEELDEERKQEQDELRDSVPESPALKGKVTRRRTVAKKGDQKPGAVKSVAAVVAKVEADELPRPLQRVRSRRVEERNGRLDAVRSGKSWEEKIQGTKAEKIE